MQLTKSLRFSLVPILSALLASQATALWPKKQAESWEGLLDADSFTTPHDNTAPFVALTYPQQGALVKQTNAVVEVNFSESIDDSSVTPATFVVSDGSKIVPGAIEHVGNTLRFYAEVPFDDTTTYTVIVSDNISDLSGNPLVAPYRWSFTINPSQNY